MVRIQLLVDKEVGEAYEVGGYAGISEDAGGDGRQCAAETVSGADDFICWVLCAGFGHGVDYYFLGFAPGGPEAGGYGTVVAECRWGGDEGEIRDPVLEGL